MSVVQVETFGCRLNLAESDAIARIADVAGAGPLAVINACAVTGEAMRQARQAARRLKRERPDAKIIIAGCAAEIDAAAFSAMAEVDHVLGNSEKLSRDVWLRIATDRAERVLVGGAQSEDGSGRPPAVAETRTRAFVEIQNGCDHRCTFCIIPFARGPSRSRDPDAILAEVRRLVAGGVPEIVLTGVDITSYGQDAPGAPRLGGLVRRILAEVSELARLRLSSIDSIEVDADLARAIAENERLMPHLHLSLQSGDDMILKRMKRRHRREDAIRFCQETRRARPDMAFSADFIAGFPTETEAMFEGSLRLVGECDLARAHVFPFSARVGTPAARMPQTPAALVRERAARLRGASEQAWARHLCAKVGRTHRLLTERGGVGRAADFTPVRVANVPAGVFCDVRVETSDGRELQGVAVAS